MLSTQSDIFDLEQAGKHVDGHGLKRESVLGPWKMISFDSCHLEGMMILSRLSILLLV